MDFNNTVLIISACFGGILFVLLMALYFISRKSQRVMQSMIDIITAPNRARIQDASRVLQTIMADEIKKISDCFQTMHTTLRTQIVAADELREKLGTQNEELVKTAANTTKLQSRAMMVPIRLERTKSFICTAFQ